MKTRIYVLTVMAIFIASTVTASIIPTLTVTPTENNKVLVEFKSCAPVMVGLSIKNSLGEVMYSKKSEKPVEELRMIFDFHYKQYGVYDVCIDYQNCKISRKIKMENNRLTNVGKEERAFGPYCSFEDNLLKISYLNNNLQNVQMNIYHEGIYMAGKNLGKEMCIQKAFDLSKLVSGQYTIVLSNTNENYQFVVNR